MIELFAITTRGLEAISAEEMARLPGLQVQQTSYRRVAVRYNGPVAALLQLRTVDDLFLHLATWQGILTTRQGLAQLQAASGELELWQALSIRDSVQTVGDIPTFSVSANFVGKRNYTSSEIKAVVAAGISAAYGWQYAENDDASDLNIRLFIEHEVAVVGMRLASHPLHRRTYKQSSVPGSLKSTVAAAMLWLAGVKPAASVLDPCCGAGTILLEAARWGATAQGGDIDPAAVAASYTNAQHAQLAVAVQTWDAHALPLADQSVDHVVSNLPWGRQVQVDDALADFYGALGREMQRVLATEGSLVLLTNLPHLVTMPALTCQRQLEISLFGQNPTLMLFTRS